MGKSKRYWLLAAFCLTSLWTSTGCTYLQNRGNDALDILNVGVTTSSEPGFSFYAGFLNILTGGYSNVDGSLHGLGGREFGSLAMRHNAVGLVLWGHEQLGYETFDPDDPQSPKPWKVGVVGLIDGPGPPSEEIMNCPKLIHLGWVGIALNCKFGELADFLLGWTTLDIMGDDGVPDEFFDGPALEAGDAR